jgi:hypothetical protein
MDFKATTKYDLFFSSRAIEYFDNQVAVIKKISTLLNSSGRGIIISKNPDFGFPKRRDPRPQHSGQLSIGALIEFLQAEGLADINCYPAVVRLPVIDRFSTRLSEYLYRRVCTSKLEHGSILSRFSESYIVTFKKP